MSRNGDNSSGTLNMDDLKYYYYDAAGGVFDPVVSIPSNATNKLAWVNDNQTTTAAYTGDIEDMSSTTNYAYDASGQLTEDEAECISSIEWSAAGKVLKINRSTSCTVAGSYPSDIEYKYNASGQRVVKIEKPRNQTTGVLENQSKWVYTYYVPDASGNLMAVFSRNFTNTSGSNYTDNWTLAEQYVYGSERLGSREEDVTVNGTFTITGFTTVNGESVFNGSSYGSAPAYTDDHGTGTAGIYSYDRTLGHKKYELTDHLSNVQEIISDRKISDQDGSTGNTEFYTADVLSYSDYYPFGSLMPGRQGTSTSYRYSFQGQECDPEIKGEGNSYNYEYRMHDPRLGRFLSLDPLAPKYPFYSPYAFSGNRVIDAVELEGLEPSTDIVKEGKLTKPMIGFLSKAFDYSVESLEETRWLTLNQFVMDPLFIVASEALRKGSSAITLGRAVVYAENDNNGNNQYWSEMAAHEQLHRDEIHEQGWFWWYTTYLTESSIFKYLDMPSEQRAYAVGMGSHHSLPSELDDYFGKASVINPGKKNFDDFNNLLTDPTTSEAKKTVQLKALGLKEFAIPRLQKELQFYQGLANTANQTLKNTKPEDPMWSNIANWAKMCNDNVKIWQQTLNNRQSELNSLNNQATQMK